METKKSLTTEELSKRFKNQFDMVNYAISLTEGMLRSGRTPRVEVDNNNPVVQVLGEILAGEDRLEDIMPIVQEVKEVFVVSQPETVPHSRGTKVREEREEFREDRPSRWDSDEKPRRRKALAK